MLNLCSRGFFVIVQANSRSARIVLPMIVVDPFLRSVGGMSILLGRTDNVNTPVSFHGKVE